MNQRGNPLRVFGVGKALEEAVRGAGIGKAISGRSMMEERRW